MKCDSMHNCSDDAQWIVEWCGAKLSYCDKHKKFYEGNEEFKFIRIKND